MEWLAVFVAGVIGVLALLFKGRSEGREQEQGKQAKHQQGAAREARKVEEDSRTLSDGDVIQRMRDRNKR
jgi:hypothetical protein